MTNVLALQALREEQASHPPAVQTGTLATTVYTGCVVPPFRPAPNPAATVQSGR
jgi:hypothetical protein